MAANLALAQASESQRLAILQANSEEWKAAASVRGYLEREDRLRQFLTPARFIYWILVDLDEHTDTNDGVDNDGSIKKPEAVLAACEATWRAVYVGWDGAVAEKAEWAVSSVYTPERRRGKGYASLMMRLLADHLASEGPDVVASVLYSDIGPTFYSRLGWRVHRADQIRISVPLDGDAASPVSWTGKMAVPKTRLLESNDIGELAKADCIAVRAGMSAMSAEHPGRTVFTHVPAVDRLGWFWIREDTFATDIFARPPVHRGAMVVGPGFDQPGERVWCYWGREWTNRFGRSVGQAKNHLYLLRIVIEGIDSVDPARLRLDTAANPDRLCAAIAALVQAAQTEASQWQIDDVVIWNPSPLVDAAIRQADPSAVAETRKTGSLPSLLWLDDRSAGGAARTADVVWTPNDKLGWC